MMAALSAERNLSCCVIEHTETVEDYLKTIFGLSAQGEPAGTSALAGRLGVAPPTASAMVKRLEEGDLVAYAGRGRVVLTEHGHGHALAIVRRHRLLETFLHQVLDVAWDEVHAEAERLEHALSEHLEDRIATALGNPARDPHGDPIPPKNGPHEEGGDLPLEGAAPGDQFVVERVSDRDSDALRYLAGLGIRPGVSLRVEDRAPFGGPLWVRAGAESHALGSMLVPLIHGRIVAPEQPPGERRHERARETARNQHALASDD